MARYDFCPQCGTANANGDFCINCGASLVTSDDVVDRDAPAPTVPIPVVPTPQGYLDENGRPVGVQPSGERGPQGDAPRRGVSKKLIAVAVAIVVVVAAVCGWLVWRDRQHRSSWWIV